jgi:hypothetical protein
VTHDELRTLLPRYAAGELDEAEALVIRNHLGSGCPECLDTVFTPNAAPPPRLLVAQPAVTPRRPSRGWVLVLGLLALVFAASTAGLITLLATRERERRAAAEQTAARVAELDRARAELEGVRRDLETRAAEATTARTAAEAEARRQAEAAQVSADAAAELARRLESAEARVAELSRGVRSREAEIGRLLAGAEVRALGDLAATPGVQVLRLIPDPSAQGARGHVLWHPARERILLYVFDLPDGRYRVRTYFDQGVVAAGPTLRLDRHGEATAAINLGVRGARLRAVEVLRNPGDERVLEGRLP